MSLSAQPYEEPFVSESEEETRAFAQELARNLEPGDVLALQGDLGSGKTCFVQGLAAGLDVHDVVASPTYLILHEHHGRLPLYHMDLYRLKSPAEVLAFGFEEYLDTDGVLVIEWPEQALDFLPARAYHVFFECGQTEDKRKITVEHKGGSSC